MEVHVCEEHGDVVDIWRQLLSPGAHVVIFDQHLDYKPIAPDFLRDIASKWMQGAPVAPMQAPAPFFDSWTCHYGLDNFLKVVIDRGLVSELTWVYAPASNREGAAAALFRDAVEALSWIPFEGGSFLSSLRADERGVMTFLGGLPLRICTFEQLKLHPPNEPIHVDIDLDYFVQADGRRIVQPWRPVTGWIRRLRSSTGALTVTRSVASGYLPLRLASLSDRFIAGVNGTPATIGLSPAWAELPEWKAVALGRRVGPREFDRLVASGLPDYISPAFEGPRRGLQALLAVRAGRIAMAEALCAVADGYGAASPFARLHAASCHLREGRHEHALRVLSRLLDGSFDSVHLRARVLAGAAYLATRDVDRALTIARELVTLVPMRPEGYLIGVQASEMRNRRSAAHRWQQALMATNRLRILNGRTIHWARHLEGISAELLAKEAAEGPSRAEVLRRHRTH